MADGALSLCERVEALTPNFCSIGVANTKGAWKQIVAATAFQYEAIQVDLMLDSSSGGGEVFLVDIGIGAAGSETVIVPNILLDLNRALISGAMSLHLNLPVQVRAGVRIAARCQDIGGAGTRNVRVSIVGKAGGANYPRAVCGAITTYGALTASTNGTLVDSGATANTFGAWTQLTAATTANHNFIQAVVGNDQQTSGNSSGGGACCDFQIAVGASGSEQIIGQGMWGNGYANGNVASFEPIRPFIPEGSRISMRSKSTLAAAADRHSTFILLAG